MIRIVLLILLTALPLTSTAAEKTETAVFAGGCFWCMQPPFDELDGVLDTEAGYTGGHVEDPDYRQVTAGDTGHVEAVRVRYHPARISYRELLQVFWRNVDPLDDGGQFCDRGAHYRSAIFATASQREAARASKTALEGSGRFNRPIATDILEAETFYPAEEYHQDYYRKRPLRYRFYVHRCGRSQRLEEVWGEEAK